MKTKLTHPLPALAAPPASRRSLLPAVAICLLLWVAVSPSLRARPQAGASLRPVASHQTTADTTAAQPDPLLRATTFLSEYIQRASVSGNEKAAGTYLADLCREMGLDVRVFTDETDSYNFSASLFPLELQKPNIILLSHIDVVPAADTADWTYPPFSGAIAGGYVWGRGALDIKSLAIMQLMALEDLKNSLMGTDFPYNISLLCVSGEEEGGAKGAGLVTEYFFEELNPLVVLGEGGSGISGVVSKNPAQEIFCVSVADKQGLWLELHHRLPSSGHGSVPPQAYASKSMVTSLDRLLRRKPKYYFSPTNKAMFAELGKMEGGLRGFALRNMGFFKPLVVPALRKNPVVAATVSNTITLTGIHTPEGSINQIPQEMMASLDCRLLPGTNTQQFIRYVKKSLGRNDIDIRVVQQTTPAGVSPTATYYTYLQEALEGVYAGARVSPVVFPAFTDNNYFRARGVPVYGINPIFLDMEEVKKVHNTDERISLENLDKGIQVYRQFLSRFAPIRVLAGK
jgi:carboxypeptidase PM20D1